MRLGFTPQRWRLPLRAVLVIVTLIILLLPLGGLSFFRIYENELIRQTEVELISQAAPLAAAFKERLAPLGKPLGELGRPARQPLQVGTAFDDFTPVVPTLDLGEAVILPQRPDGRRVRERPERRFLFAGSRMMDVLGETRKVTLAGVKILDYNGIAIAGAEEVGQSFAHLEEVREALTGKYVSVLRERIPADPRPALESLSRGTGVRVFVAFPIRENERVLGVVYLSRTPQNILQHMFWAKDRFIVAGIALLILTCGVALFTSYTITRPIHRLIARTKRFVAGDLEASRPLRRPVTREVDRLSKSFSEMANALHERNEYIRQFAMHVSHEFKTPLTAIQGAAEILQDHLEDMPAKERKKFLKNIEDDAERLRNLVTRLMELARADSLSPGTDTARIQDVLPDVLKRFKRAKFKIRVKDESDGMALMISRDALESSLANLLDNSRQHGATAAAISISDDGERAHIVVSDNGEGISPANAEKIFTPFFTTKRTKGGTGLGLDIVKSFMRAYGGDITLVPSETGATFRIDLKKAET